MKTIENILEEKFYKNYPISMEYLNDALEHAVENNLSVIKVGLIDKELPADRSSHGAVATQFIKVLNAKGFINTASSSHSVLFTKTGNYPCWRVLIFLDAATAKWYADVLTFRASNSYKERPKLPQIFEDLEYVDIYKGKR